jgi:PAS domain S-box-containing protein
MCYYSKDLKILALTRIFFLASGVKAINQFFSSKLTKKYLVISLLLTFCALSLLYIITYEVMNASVREEIDHRNQVLAKTVGKNMDYIFSQTVNDLKMISANNSDIQNQETVSSEEVENIISQNPLIQHIKIFDASGNEIYTIPDLPVPYSDKTAEVFDRISWSKTYYITDMFSLKNGKNVIAIAYPLIGEDEKVEGGIIAYISLDVLSRYLNQVKIGDEGINAIVDRSGMLIGHTNRLQIGRELSGHPIGIDLYTSKSGIWSGPLFGEDMVFAYHPIQMGNFGVIVGEPLEQALTSAKDVQGWLLMGFLTVLFLTFIFTLLATSSIVKPIASLTTQTREYKEGSRSSFQRLKTGDEIEDLSVVMEEMATQLFDKEKKLFNILESIPYAVITTDRRGKIETFNRSAEQLTLFSHSEVVGKKMAELPIHHPANGFWSWNTLEEGEKINELENEIFDKSGKKHVVKIYSSLFYDEKQRNVGAIHILRDVSEVKKLEAYLKQSERMASLGQLTAGIAHEIKNPLSIIMAATDAIELELDEEKIDAEYIKEMTTDIIETSDRMNHLLTDFLKMSKGESETRKSSVNLVDIVNELLSLLRKKLDDHKITARFTHSVDIALVSASENQLNQVFLNILINSIQALEHGGMLDIAIEEFDSDWKISIKDTGKGIQHTDIEWIFHPFYTTKKEGTGLGLSIAYEIISQHAGKIEAESAVGKGTAIQVRLPKLKEGVLNE